MWMNILTAVCCVAIILIAYKYWLPLKRLRNFINAWDECKDAQDIERQYAGMKEIDNGYQETMFVLDDSQKKTTNTLISASLLFLREEEG
jgi:hypothetical protein